MVERIRTLLESRQLTPTQFADSIGIARPIVSHILSGRNKPSLEVVQRILAAMPDLSMPWLLNGTGPMLAGAPAAPATPVAPPAPATVAPVMAVPAPTRAHTGPSDSPGVPDKDSAASVSRARRPMSAPNPARNTPTPGASSTQEPKRFAPKAPNLPPSATIQSETVTQAAVEALAVPIAVPIAVPASAVNQSAAPVAAAALAVSAVSAASTEATPTTTALLARTEKPIRRIVIFYHDGSFADYRPE